MRKQSFPFLMVFMMGCLMALVPGCRENSPTEPAATLVKMTHFPDVRAYANYHNAQVDRLLQLDADNNCLRKNLELEFENLLHGMEEQNPQMAVDPQEIRQSRELLPKLMILHLRDHHHREIHALLQKCLHDFGLRPETHPSLLESLRFAIRLLTAGDAAGLGPQLAELESLANELGSQGEKCVVGVFLGSFERAMATVNIGMKRPWFWPAVVMYDMVGSLVGGAGVASIFSASAELIFFGVVFSGTG